MGFNTYPKNDDEILFIGGCGNFAPSQGFILNISRGGDLYTSKKKIFQKKHSLSKMAMIQDKLLLFGGLHNSVEIFDKNLRTFKSHEELTDTLIKNVKKVNHAVYFLTKCSYALSMEN